MVLAAAVLLAAGQQAVIVLAQGDGVNGWCEAYFACWCVSGVDVCGSVQKERLRSSKGLGGRGEGGAKFCSRWDLPVVSREHA